MHKREQQQMFEGSSTKLQDGKAGITGLQTHTFFIEQLAATSENRFLFFIFIP